MTMSLNPIKKLIKRVGAKRVSEDATRELAEILEKNAIKICKRANKLAKLAGRKTVMRKDIKLAAKEILERK